jgi:site-specific DNA recombinase
VPCPSQADPDRNWHRQATGWTLRTVVSILANPRYTGRQVWNRQYTDHGPADHPAGRGRPVLRWSHAHDWVISTDPAHVGLVSEADFVAVQHGRAAPPSGDGERRTYVLAGRLRCGICGRRMEAHWINNRPGYRCRHGRTSARSAGRQSMKSLYLREDRVLARLAADLGQTDVDARGLADYLHAEQITITCDASWTRQDTAG